MSRLGDADRFEPREMAVDAVMTEDLKTMPPTQRSAVERGCMPATRHGTRNSAALGDGGDEHRSPHAESLDGAMPTSVTVADRLMAGGCEPIGDGGHVPPCAQDD